MIAAVEKLCVISQLFVLINNIMTKQNLKVSLKQVGLTIHLSCIFKSLEIPWVTQT